MSFWLCPIGQNFITWSHVAARESGDVDSNRVAVCPAKTRRFLGIYPTDTQAHTQNDPSTGLFIVMLSEIPTAWEQPKCLSTGHLLSKLVQ